MDEISLRQVQEADLAIFFEQQLVPEATRMAAFPGRTRDAFMAHWARCMADGSTTLRTILFHGEVAGNIVCWEQEGERRIAMSMARRVRSSS